MSSHPFKAIEVVPGTYWVGAVDWNLRDFHGYLTERGSTYNAFLVLADKVTLLDTVKAPFADEMLSRIASVVDPGRIEYVVSNHSELDHTGALPRILERIKPSKVFASVNGVKALKQHFHWDREITAVRDGETLDLGGKSLRFIETRMLHWPDSIFTYLEPDGVLFSQDGFGMHLASSERFADQVDPAMLRYEAGKYYANILLPFSTMVATALEKAAALEIAVIAPDHGPIWRKDLAWIVERYKEWAAQKPALKAVIVYDTMWGSTERMASAIENGLAEKGVHVRNMSLRQNHRSNIVAEVLEAGALVVGSPTLNNNLYPSVADFLTYLKGLRRKNLIGAAFGSHGWSGQGAAQVKEQLEAMDVDLVAGPVAATYVPDADTLVQCHELGRTIGAKLAERCAGKM